MTFERDDNCGKHVLIVGAIAGSGTRKVVEMLTNLGVKMVVDDQCTNDIHGECIGGWPPHVNRAMSENHTVDIDTKAFHPEKRRLLLESLRKLLNYTTGLAAETAEAHDRPNCINYGFKAPVSMTLTPWWHEVLPYFKFLHVIRDGRDIAVSANQFDVEKYYAHMYPNDRNIARNEVAKKAMRLWSDWNTQVNKFSLRVLRQTWFAENGNAKKGQQENFMDYMIMHSEATISEDLITRFGAYRQMAKFVGSQLTVRELCCLAKKETHYMGSHDPSYAVNAHQAGASGVKSRYGKWKKMLANKPALMAALEKIGGQALKRFDYDAAEGGGWEAVVQAGVAMASEQFSCTHETVCPKKALVRGICKFAKKTEFKDTVQEPAGDLVTFRVDSSQDCCEACDGDWRCVHFTYYHSDRRCVFKKWEGLRQNMTHATSGIVSTRAACNPWQKPGEIVAQLAQTLRHA